MIEALFFSISGGMFTVLGTARLADIAWKFVRLVGLLTLALGSVATALSIQTLRAGGEGSATWIVVCGACLSAGGVVVSLAAPLAATKPAFLRWVALGSGICGVAASAMCAVSFDGVYRTPAHRTLLIVSQACGAWLLGSITLAWLLGHAYLTATKMTIAPLKYFSRMLSAAVIVRILLLTLTIGLAWLIRSEMGLSVWRQLEQWWLIVFLRIGVGLVAVGVMTYMVADCVRLRSTQSATGILYFASVMAYVGELASQYLTRELGWPL